MKSDSVALVIAERLLAWAALLIFGFVSHPVLSSVQPVPQSTPKSDTVVQSSETMQKSNGVITASLSVSALVDQFENEKVFWRQFEVAKEIVRRHDASVLSSLVDWLKHEDRHIRGNVAFIFGRLGDARGFQVIRGILTDRSERPEAQGLGIAINDRKYHVELQIRQDRYYAVHLLGELGDAQAVSVLVPLLKDPDINYKVAWALGQIGDRRAVGPLLNALDDGSPSMCVAAIQALDTLHAQGSVASSDPFAERQP